MAFDGTAIIVSHDREFLDGLVSKVYEFGGGQVREHIGGIYDFLRTRKISELNELNMSLAQPSKDVQQARQSQAATSAQAAQPSQSSVSYAEHKEQQKRKRKLERQVEECERKIASMEARLKELDELLCDPKNASDMTLVSEYTDTKRQLDEEVERWEKVSEELLDD